ncbi:MAG: family 16 glycosylhydrolase [Bacteroidales bacterium]|nr:family 16 glycosylhydrolase [Bacteroidales bacterium]MCF8455785.1 family 16 glycosylhydrolase [Bacteroidales bacterium]
MKNTLHFYILLLAATLCGANTSIAQTSIIYDDFEGNGTITTWFGDDCGINTNLSNPVQQGNNTSATVLEYHDIGGQYANVRFDVSSNLDLSSHYTFSLKVFIPASGLTGSQPNQVSLKLQDGTIGAPWSTQSEIIKALSLDQWQTITFDFLNDTYINLDGASPPPTQRTDFNRVVIQLNGEDNNDHVLAYIDDVDYDGTVPSDPVFDNLVWSDEFDVDGAINSTNWFHQTQLPNGGSWYNGEIQHYTDRLDNSYVENGILKIVAKKETYTDQGQTKQYTSARLNSKFAFQYGKVEFRAKLPTGVGTWPALWTLGKNVNENGGYWDNEGFGTASWPACGEIDIMEHWGTNQNYVQSATHTPSSYGGTVNLGGQMIATASTDFHVYTLEWSAEKLVFSVDNMVHYTYNPPIKDANTWPFDAEQYILLNVAILPGIDPNFSASNMEIDYVRVYQSFPVSVAHADENPKPSYCPNPVDNELNIILGKVADQDVIVRVYNVDGILVRTHYSYVQNNIISLDDLGFLSQGMYFISYEVDERAYVHKVMKN